MLQRQRGQMRVRHEVGIHTRQHEEFTVHIEHGGRWNVGSMLIYMNAAIDFY